MRQGQEGNGLFVGEAVQHAPRTEYFTQFDSITHSTCVGGNDFANRTALGRINRALQIAACLEAEKSVLGQQVLVFQGTLRGRARLPESDCLFYGWVDRHAAWILAAWDLKEKQAPLRHYTSRSIDFGDIPTQTVQQQQAC